MDPSELIYRDYAYVYFLYQKHGITYIVNVSANIEQPADVDNEHFLRCPVNDGYIDKLQPFFAEAHKFIGELWY